MNDAIVLIPRVSEKAYGLSTARRTYVFDVQGANNKHTVARAVESQYGVTVTSVNVTNLKGKAKRTVRKGGRGTVGRTSDVKKAYVTLKDGDSLPIFSAIEEASAKEEKANEQFAKVVEKAAAKEEKQTAKDTKKAAKAEKETK
jgi:large subunit ribosomal protein L23